LRSATAAGVCGCLTCLTCRPAVPRRCGSLSRRFSVLCFFACMRACVRARACACLCARACVREVCAVNGLLLGRRTPAGATNSSPWMHRGLCGLPENLFSTLHCLQPRSPWTWTGSCSGSQTPPSRSAALRPPGWTPWRARAPSPRSLHGGVRRTCKPRRGAGSAAGSGAACRRAAARALWLWHL
jgi:hypothetical protein